MRYFKKLVGEKCYLSPLNLDDAEMYTAWLNDLEVTRNLAMRKNIDLFHEREALEKLAKEEVYAIVDAATDEAIGNAGLHALDAVNRKAEVGLFIGNKAYWNRGYGEEALRLLVGYGFDYLNLHNIMLCVFDFNERGIACYRKIGFKEIGHRREALCLEGRYHDIISMDLLEDEFRELEQQRRTAR